MQAGSGQRQGGEKRRRDRQRVHGRAQIMHEAGKGELCGPCASARDGRGFAHLDVKACTGQDDRGG